MSPLERQVLLERAARHAAPQEPPPEGDTLEVLVFRVGGEAAAVLLTHLRAVLAPALTPLPDVRPEVLGVQGVRGEVVGVLALHRLLELPASPPGQEAQVLLLETPQGRVGWWVDAVEGTRQLPQSALRPGHTGRPGLRGVLEGTVLLLDPPELHARLSPPA